MALQDINDRVEKLIYPLEIGDKYDTGASNELNTQINVFQGSLEYLNYALLGSPSHIGRSLPKPNSSPKARKN